MLVYLSLPIEAVTLIKEVTLVEGVAPVEGVALIEEVALVEGLALVEDVVFVEVAVLVELSVGNLIVGQPMVPGIVFRFSRVRLQPSNAGKNGKKKNLLTTLSKKSTRIEKLLDTLFAFPGPV